MTDAWSLATTWAERADLIAEWIAEVDEDTLRQAGGNGLDMARLRFAVATADALAGYYRRQMRAAIPNTPEQA